MRWVFFFFQAEDGIRDAQESRGLGDVYKRQSLDGVKLQKPIDLYDAERALKEFHLLDFWPDPGVYTVRLECVGKDPLRGGFELGLESVRLRERRPRVAAFGHDRDKDWRKNPTLYR